MRKTLMAVDGNSLMYRAFYAIPILTNADGEYTNAVFGFFSMLINAMSALAPDYVAIAFDMKGKTFRHDSFAEYKGTRKETPQELIPQFGTLKKALEDIGITVLQKEGYEADDILGVLSRLSAENGLDSVLLTGDKDALQLVSDSCRVMLTRKGVSELEIYDVDKLYEVYQLKPEQIVDLKGFMGDKSDNIPGVPGVGEKTALNLLYAYNNMDGVYAHLDEVKGKLKDKLAENKELALLSRSLAKIDVFAPVDVTMSALAFSGMTAENAGAVFEGLSFTSLLKRIGASPILPETAQVECVTIDHAASLKAMIEEAMRHDILAMDFGGDITVAFSQDKQYVIVSEHSLLNLDFSRESVLQALRPLLEDSGVFKLLYDAKSVIPMLGDYGVGLNGKLFDVKLAEYAIDPASASLNLHDLVGKYNLSGCAAAIYGMYGPQTAKMKEDGVWSVYHDIEMPLMRVLLDMEQTGFRIDLNELKAYDDKLTAEIDTLTSAIYELCGFSDFNINSTKQLGQVLFERLGLPSGKKGKNGYSTDIEVLEKLSGKHPVIDRIIEYRRRTKLKSTYIDGLKKIADSEGFVHTTFVQISTVTGRISSKEPNLQNIPIRTQEGREIRRLFLPSTNERSLVAADYSQIELRILAAISDDDVMKDTFAAGIDIHTRTASEVFGVPIDAVTDEMRRSAKAVNFGIVYGISDFGLARNLNIPVKRAAGYIERYFARFSAVRAYMDEIIAKAKADGYVTTLLGRRRNLPELRSNNYNVRSFGERAALNTPIQGTAADIIKLAMIDVSDKLGKGGYASKLILQVHDELVIDTAADEVSAVKALLKECMENAYPMSVPLQVQVSVGSNWLVAK